ncbi:hypothetical protein V8G54_020454, partial [Vigna mungo]
LANDPPPSESSCANDPPPPPESHRPSEEVSSLHPPTHPVPPQSRLIAGVKRENPRRRSYAAVFSPPSPPCRRRWRTKYTHFLRSSQPPSTVLVSSECRRSSAGVP